MPSPFYLCHFLIKQVTVLLNNLFHYFKNNSTFSCIMDKNMRKFRVGHILVSSCKCHSLLKIKKKNPYASKSLMWVLSLLLKVSFNFLVFSCDLSQLQ